MREVGHVERLASVQEAARQQLVKLEARYDERIRELELPLRGHALAATWRATYEDTRHGATAYYGDG